MSSEHPLNTESSRRYAQAYAMHYAKCNLLGALQAYDDVIEQHPTAPEAEYSRSQMRNIVKSVVPAPELLSSQLDLVRQHLNRIAAESTAVV